MENIVKGSNDPPHKEDFGIYLFNSIKSSNQDAILMVDADTREEVTVKRFHQNVIRFTYALKEFVKQGDVIACICENEWITLVPVVASIYLGTTISMVNPLYNPRELTHNFNLTTPKVVLCTKASLKTVFEVKPQFDCIEKVILMEEETVDGLPTIFDLIKAHEHQNLDDFKPEHVEQDKTALILSSSGTSGPPKGVLIDYANLTVTAVFVRRTDYVGVNPNVTVLVLVPTFHVFGLYVALFATMFQSKMVFLKKFKPDVFLKTLQDYKVTKLMLVPSVALFLAKSPVVDQFDLSNLTDIISGAAPLAQHIVETLKKKFDVVARQVYGLTEVGGVSCMQPNSPMKPHCSGAVVPNLEVAIKDVDTREILPKNKNGEICLRGPAVFKAYINNPEANAHSFDGDGFFLTGDIGYFDDDDCLYIVDRFKELIKYKGFQVSPAELEAILLTHPAVKEVAVIGLPDERAGELPCAIVKRRPNVFVTEEELIKFLGDQVSPHKKLTGGVKFMDDIPKNATGKIMKRLIKEHLSL